MASILMTVLISNELLRKRGQLLSERHESVSQMLDAYRLLGSGLNNTHLIS